MLAMLAMLAAACGGDGDDDAADDTERRTFEAEDRDEGEPQQGGAVSVGVEAEAQGWDPATAAWSAATFNQAYAMFDPLMANTEDGEVEGYLAESLEPNEDASEFTLTLREGITFHDGTPLNAEAVAYNLEHMQSPASVVSGILEDVETFEVTGELTGVYRLTDSNAAFPDVLTGAAGMMVSPTAHEADPEGFANNPVGTGPFEFGSWSRDDALVVNRYEDYWQEGLPYLDRVTFRPIPDEDTRLQSLTSGGVEAMQSLRQSIVQQALDLDEQGTVEANVYVGNNSGSAIFNTVVPPMDDVRVRRALAMGLDQELLIDVLGGAGISPVMSQYHSPDSPWYSEAVAEAWPTNRPDEAMELIQEYVDDPDRSDGQAPGSPIQLEFNCPPDPSLIELSQVYQALWQELGPVQVQLNQVEQATHIANAIGSAQDDPPYSGNYMINCFRVGEESDPYLTFDAAFSDPATNPTNFTNYTSPVIEENLATLRESTDFDERFEAVEAIGLDIAENVPNTFTGATATMIATLPEVNGITSWTLPDGQRGEGTPEAITRWGHVWKDQ
jgi:peptide/nickel transport system substrate-binding protein